MENIPAITAAIDSYKKLSQEMKRIDSKSPKRRCCGT
jgi:hypothetical protein